MRELVLDILADADTDYDFMAVVYDCILEQPRPLVINEPGGFRYADPDYSFRSALDDLEDWSLLTVYELYCTARKNWHQVHERIWELKDQIYSEYKVPKGRCWTTYLWDQVKHQVEIG